MVSTGPVMITSIARLWALIVLQLFMITFIVPTHIMSVRFTQLKRALSLRSKRLKKLIFDVKHLMRRVSNC